MRNPYIAGTIRVNGDKNQIEGLQHKWAGRLGYCGKLPSHKRENLLIGQKPPNLIVVPNAAQGGFLQAPMRSSEVFASAFIYHTFRYMRERCLSPGVLKTPLPGST